MANPRPAKITITRPMSTGGDSWISITLTDESSRLQMINVRIEFAEFAQALTGQGHIPCQYEVHSKPELWGTVREYKTLSFDKKPGIYHGDALREYLEECCRPHEVDGWRAQVDSAMHTRQDGATYRVGFVRYVKADEASA